MYKRFFEHIIAYTKKHKVVLIPLGTLLVISVVLGGLLIDSVYLSMLATMAGVALGTLIFQGNKKLFRQLSSMQRTRKQSPLMFLGVYLLVLLLLCSGILFLIGLYRFDMLLLTGVVLVIQLFLLSMMEAVKSIRND